MRCLYWFLLLASFVINAEQLRIVSSEFVPHNGEHLPQQGYAIELVRRIFALEQQEVRFEFLPWPRALKQAKDGEAVAIVSLWYDKARAEYLHYPTPLYQNIVRFYHHTRQPIHFQQLSELNKTKLRLGIVRGYSYHPSLKSAPFTFFEVHSDLESLKMLALGRVDLVVMEQKVAEYLLATELASFQNQISSTGPIFEEKPMYLAFSKAHPAAAALQQKFEQGMQRLKQQQRFEPALPKYLP